MQIPWSQVSVQHTVSTLYSVQCTAHTTRIQHLSKTTFSKNPIDANMLRCQKASTDTSLLICIRNTGSGYSTHFYD